MVAGANDTTDPIEAARDDIAGSKDIIASAVEDLNQHQRWLESYRVSETKHARRVRRLELMYQLGELAKRVLLALKRFAFACGRAVRSLSLFVVRVLVRAAQAIGTAFVYLYGLARSAVMWTAAEGARACSRDRPLACHRLRLDCAQAQAIRARHVRGGEDRFQLDAAQSSGLRAWRTRGSQNRFPLDAAQSSCFRARRIRGSQNRLQLDAAQPSRSGTHHARRRHARVHLDAAQSSGDGTRHALRSYKRLCMDRAESARALARCLSHDGGRPLVARRQASSFHTCCSHSRCNCFRMDRREDQSFRSRLAQGDVGGICVAWREDQGRRSFLLQVNLERA